MKGGPYNTNRWPYKITKRKVVLTTLKSDPYKTTKLKVVLPTLISGPYKTKKSKVVFTTRIGGPYNMNMLSYINDGSNCATYSKTNKAFQPLPFVSSSGRNQ